MTKAQQLAVALAALVAVGAVGYSRKGGDVIGIDSPTGCVAAKAEDADCLWGGPYALGADGGFRSRGLAVGAAQYAKGAECVPAHCSILGGNKLERDEVAGWYEADKKGAVVVREVPDAGNGKGKGGAVEAEITVEVVP